MTAALRPLRPEDAPACDAIIAGLPEWFGHEGGRAACAEAVRVQRGLVATAGDEVIGFVTLQPRTSVSVEATWMAVRRDRRGRGVGTGIIERLCADLTAEGFRLALAMTSAAVKAPPETLPFPDSYESTRAFWRARGFLPLIELDIWDTDIALLSVRPLAPPRSVA